MNEDKTPTEKYISVCNGCDHPENREELKEHLLDSMLKKEMVQFAEDQKLDVNPNWTKDKIADEMVDPNLQNKLLEEVPIERPEKGETEEFGRLAPESFTPGKREALRPFTQMFTEPLTRTYDSSSEMWKALTADVDENIRKFTDRYTGYWEDLESVWSDRAKEFQENINQLRESQVDVEDYKELSVVWRNFYNKMSARFLRISNSVKKRQGSLREKIDEYNERAQEVVEEGEPDMTELYGLWFDMANDIREEMFKIREDIETGQEELNETWTRFSKKTVEMLENMQDMRNEQVKNLFTAWKQNFEFMNDTLERGFEDYRKTLETFWESPRERITEIMMETTKDLKDNYAALLENSINMMNRNYKNMFKRTVPNVNTDELKDLKRRISNLEDKISE